MAVSVLGLLRLALTVLAVMAVTQVSAVAAAMVLQAQLVPRPVMMGKQAA